MKKTKFLGLSLAAAITLTGAGYAYWNDSVTITSTVSTGKVECKFDTTQTSYIFNENNRNGANAVATAGVNYTDQQDVSVTVNNLYPGATFTKDFVIDNNSTIPVRLRNIVFNPTSDFDATKATIEVKFDLNNDEVFEFTVSNILDTAASKQVLEQLNKIEIPTSIRHIKIQTNVSINQTDNINNDNEMKNFTLSMNPYFEQFNNPNVQ